MLARRLTLKKGTDFKRIQKEGKTIQSESFGLAFLNRGDSEASLYGFVISTKIAKESVARHRVARALSEAVRYLLTEIKPGYNVVFLAKPICLRKSTDELMREVRPILEKAKLLK